MKHLWWFLFLATLYLSFSFSKFDLFALVEGFSNSIALIGEMIPPKISGVENIINLTVQTIVIGLWGTIIGSFISLPVGFLSARNTSPNLLIYYIFRGLVTFLRSIPELLYALVLVVSFGIGPLPGIIALAISTVGLLGKFYSEAIESVDTRPLEALRATGSHSIQVFRYAIIPQILPSFVGYNLYLLDHNIRVAIVLGVVGAGGLGIELFSQIRSFNYPQVGGILVVILIVVSIIDRLSAKLRNDIYQYKLLAYHTKTKDVMVLVTIFILSLLSLKFLPIDTSELINGFKNLLPLLGDFLKLDFSELKTYLMLMLETIAIALTGTTIAVLLSVQLGMLMARNLVNNAFITNLLREMVNFLRAIPELVLALIFVSAVGLGPFAGVLAIALHTTGFLAKFYSEIVEDLDYRPIEALEAVGARLIQTIRHAIIPMILPLFNSYNLYILDRNVRAATVMGVVGAGGIGFELVMRIKLFEFDKVSAMILVIVFTLLIIDYFSAYLRRRFM
nr:phosphonate ABC transporter, permease protein PhnE [Thermodesulfobacterium sp. TA1]